MSVRVLTMMRPRGRGEQMLPLVAPSTREHSPHRPVRVSVWCVRWACAVAVMPVLLLANSAASAHRAACLHLLSAPFTAPYLQRWACESGDDLSAGLCRYCLFVGNLAALLLLAPGTASDTLAVFWVVMRPTTMMTPAPAVIIGDPTAALYGGVWVPWAHALAASALCAGCAQLLYTLPKDNVLRVMGCTACAVLVGALAVAAALSPAPLARRLFQSAALPFWALFGETSRPSSSSSASSLTTTTT